MKKRTPLSQPNLMVSYYLRLGQAVLLGGLLLLFSLVSVNMLSGDVAFADTVHQSTDGERMNIVSTPISYYLADFDDPLNTIDSLNSFIAGRGTWISNPVTCPSCAPLLTASWTDTVRYGDSGGSLRLQYNVELSKSLASYYEKVSSGNTYYDLSGFEELRFRVKGEEGTVGGNTRFYVRFADKNWQMAYIEIDGVGSEWETKIIDLELLNGLDWNQMNEVTIIFENNHQDSTRYAYPLSGTLYFDDFIFVDTDTSIDNDVAFLELMERRAFQYFWEYADPNTGLIRDRASNPNVASIAATGFGLTAICVAEDRGWITHQEAYDRVLTTLDSFYDDPNSSDDLVVSGTHGLFWHFVDIHDGTPMKWDAGEFSAWQRYNNF